jgi:ATP-binding cassette, subfamily C (CFTR/MRP), member 1
MIRGGLISTIYGKALLLSSTTVDESLAMTLMGSDVERIVLGLTQFHELWASLIEAAIATWLLERQVGLACIAMVGLSIGLFFRSPS